jgi:transcriptional regulator with XRE-family HTH domain
MTTVAELQQETPRIPRDSFAARLVLIRHELGQHERGKILPIDDVARRCEIAPATWSTWERGTNPQNMGAVAMKIASKTGYSREWLAFGGFPLPAKRELTLVPGGRRADDLTRPTRSPLLHSVNP